MRKGIYLLIGGAAAVVTAACGDGHGHHGHGYDESGIVFGISQAIDPASGKTTTRAGYEYLELARKGGWSTTLRREGDDGVCIYEELDRRVGRPNVGDGGRARWSGGALPPGGLVVNANEEDAKLDGAAFAPGSTLSFAVDFGFAIPDIPPVPVAAPRSELAIVAPAAGELTVDPATGLAFEWSAGRTEDHPSRVMVALETEDADGQGGRRNEVRCFFDEEDGRGAIPSAFVERLGGPGTKGVVQIASHRQVTVFARGGWTVYVVGAIVHREQPFVLK